MALVNEKYTIVYGPNRWDLILTGFAGQQDIVFKLIYSYETGQTDGWTSAREVCIVKAMVLEMGPAKCPYVTHPQDRSQDEWVLLLIFRDGPLKDQYHSFYYDCSTRRGFMTERPYTPKPTA